MFNYKVKSDFSIPTNLVSEVIKIGLYNTSEKAIEKAQKYAPYETGKLKQSIGREPANVTTSTRKVIVGPRKVKYAIAREYVNYKNPKKKFYMKKTYEKIPNIAKKEFDKALKIILNKYV